MKSATTAALSLLCLTGCATMSEGINQKITVTTDPPRAACMMKRAGEVIMRFNTPDTVRVRKSKEDIAISCSKPGYDETTIINKSGTAKDTGANVDSLYLGWAFDSILGSDNHYTDSVFLPLKPAAESDMIIVPESSNPPRKTNLPSYFE